ncbi:MAG: S8 family peptidase [Limisphaerales bacterium]
MQNLGQQVNGFAGTASADIRFVPAWDLARTTTNPVVVAVVDTGTDYTHPDLTNNMWINPGEVAGNGLDDDGDGYMDDVYGYNFADNLPYPSDSGIHGTHVAGTIAAIGNNQLGVIGVNYQAKVMALRVSSDGNSISTAAEIEALEYAVMMKGKGVNLVAINASYGGGGYTESEQDAIQAVGDAGIIFCAAAGNDASDNDTTEFYPANYRLTNMIVIAASDQNDALASFSDYGANTVDLAAPGVNILSLSPVSQPGKTTIVQQGSTTFEASELTYSEARLASPPRLIIVALAILRIFPQKFKATSQ